MSDQRPTNPFTLSSSPKNERNTIRDKDNAQPRIQPPAGVSKPSPRMAPPGTAGIRRNLSAPSNDRGPATGSAPGDSGSKRFALGKSGDLGKSFKPIVQQPPDKKPGIDL